MKIAFTLAVLAAAGVALSTTRADRPKAQLPKPPAIEQSFTDDLARLTGHPTNTNCARPDLDLAWRGEWGLDVVPDYTNGPAELSNAKPLRIDGTTIKGLSAKTIDSLLMGPLGSDITIEVLIIRNAVAKVKLKRMLARHPGAARLPAQLCMANDLGFLDHCLAGDFNDSLESLRISSQTNGLELYAEALAKYISTPHGTQNEQTVAADPRRLYDLLLYFDGSGDITQADAIFKSIIKNVSTLSVLDRSDRDLYLRIAKYLEKTDRQALTEKIYKRLEAGTPGGDYSEVSPIWIAHMQMLVSQGRDKEAEALVVKFASEKHLSGSLNLVQVLASFYASHNQIYKAMALLKATAKEIEAGYAGRDNPQQYELNREQPLLLLYYQLAVALQQQAGDTDRALATLQERLKMCNENLAPPSDPPHHRSNLRLPQCH